jgi:hypothetical protein
MDIKLVMDSKTNKEDTQSLIGSIETLHKMVLSSTVLTHDFIKYYFTQKTRTANEEAKNAKQIMDQSQLVYEWI